MLLQPKQTTKSSSVAKRSFLLWDFFLAVQSVLISVAAVQLTPVTDFLLACSSFEKMKRRVAYILRFFYNIQSIKSEKRTGLLTPAELQFGQIAIL
jgi:hypothetical protein